MKKILPLILLLALPAWSQTLRQKLQAFQGSATNVSVTYGAPVTVAISVNTTQGVLQKIIVQAAGGAAGTSNDFDVRVCTTNSTYSCSSEGPHALFQKEGSNASLVYPFGLYTVANVIWFNQDIPASETLYVRITNQKSGDTTLFDIYLAGLVTESVDQ